MHLMTATGDDSDLYCDLTLLNEQLPSIAVLMAQDH